MGDKVFGIIDVGVFNAKVVNYKDEFDVSGIMMEKARCVFGRIVASFL